MNLHALIKSKTPISNNKYNSIGNVHLDSNIENISTVMLNFIYEFKVEFYITVNINEQIHGNSYEMALVLLLLGYDNISATGTLDEYNGKVLRFGKIAGLRSKLKIDKNLLHNGIIDHIVLSPY